MVDIGYHGRLEAHSLEYRAVGQGLLTRHAGEQDPM